VKSRHSFTESLHATLHFSESLHPPVVSTKPCFTPFRRVAISSGLGTPTSSQSWMSILVLNPLGKLGTAQMGLDRKYTYIYNIYNTEISKNGGTPKSSILLGFPMINHPALGDPTMGIPAQRHGAPRRTPGDGACAGAKAGWNTMGMGQKFKAHWTDHRFYSIFIHL